MHGLLRISGGDTVSMRVSAVTVQCRRELGGLRANLRWHPSSDGAFSLLLGVERVAPEEAVGDAELVFGADGTGNGIHRRFLAGNAAREASGEFRADGSLRIDGVKVVTDR